LYPHAISLCAHLTVEGNLFILGQNLSNKIPVHSQLVILLSLDSLLAATPFSVDGVGVASRCMGKPWLAHRPIQEGVSTDSLKFHAGSPFPTLICPARRVACGRLLPPWIPHAVRACSPMSLRPSFVPKRSFFRLLFFSAPFLHHE
jgi:hypothetical protein